MSEASDDRQAEEAAYLAVLEGFTEWCIERRLPFKWAMMQAIWAWQHNWKGEGLDDLPLHPVSAPKEDPCPTKSNA